MVDPQIIEEWLQKADEDFEFACSVIEESPFYTQICFHFHQAAEKYLKSLIIAWELEFKKINDLPVLLKMCLPRNHRLEALMDDCTFLNAFTLKPGIQFTGQPSIRRRWRLMQKRLLNRSVPRMTQLTSLRYLLYKFSIFGLRIQQSGSLFRQPYLDVPLNEFV